MTTSHSEQRIGNKDGASTEAIILADAFSDFISASSRLEHFYSDLQGQVTQLGRDLAERNTELNARLAEQDHISRSLQLLVAALPCGVVVVENDGAISMINPEGERLLHLVHRRGCTIETVFRHTGIDLALFLAMQSLEEDGTSSAGEEQEFYSADTGRWLTVHGRQLRREHAEAGQRYATLLTIRDITLRKQRTVEQELSYRKLAMAEAATGLAEEMRAPLASLEFFAGLAAQEAGANLNATRWIAHLRAGIRSLAESADKVLRRHGAGTDGPREDARKLDTGRPERYRRPPAGSDA